MGKHFYSYEQCQREIGPDGNERDNWTLHQGRAHTLIGRTIGKLFNWYAARQFNKQHPN